MAKSDLISKLQNDLDSANAENRIYTEIQGGLADHYEKKAGVPISQDPEDFLKEMKQVIDIGATQLGVKRKLEDSIILYKRELSESITSLISGEAIKRADNKDVFNKALSAYASIRLSDSIEVALQELPPVTSHPFVVAIDDTLKNTHRIASISITDYLSAVATTGTEAEFTYALAAVSALYKSGVLETDDRNKQVIESLQLGAQESAKRYFDKKASSTLETLETVELLPKTSVPESYKPFADKIIGKLSPTVEQMENSMQMPFQYGREVISRAERLYSPLQADQSTDASSVDSSSRAKRSR